MIATLWVKLQAVWMELAFALVALLACFAIGYSEGKGHERHEWDLANAKAIQKAAEEAETLATAIEETRAKNEADKQAIIDRYSADIQRLRKRPDLMPVAAAAACEGTTGLQLSKPDAEFLTGIARDADNIAANLTACYAREDEYRKAMIGDRK